MNIKYPRNGYKDATDIGNQMVLQELIRMPVRFFVHHLDYLVCITVITLLGHFIQEYGIYLVGAASSREYPNRTMLPWFIAAGSRSHKGR